MWAKRNRFYYCWKCKLMQTLLKSMQRGLIIIEIDQPDNLTIRLLGIFPKKFISFDSSTSSSMFIAALFKIARKWKQPKCPSTHKWLMKIWLIYISQYYSAGRKNETMKFSNKWRKLEIIILIKVIQTQDDKGLMFSPMWMLALNLSMCVHLN